MQVGLGPSSIRLCLMNDVNLGLDVGESFARPSLNLTFRRIGNTWGEKVDLRSLLSLFILAAF